jgi:hypothetical protein
MGAHQSAYYVIETGFPLRYPVYERRHVWAAYLGALHSQVEDRIQHLCPSALTHSGITDAARAGFALIVLSKPIGTRPELLRLNVSTVPPGCKPIFVPSPAGDAIYFAPSDGADELVCTNRPFPPGVVPLPCLSERVLRRGPIYWLVLALHRSILNRERPVFDLTNQFGPAIHQAFRSLASEFYHPVPFGRVLIPYLI